MLNQDVNVELDTEYLKRKKCGIQLVGLQHCVKSKGNNKYEGKNSNNMAHHLVCGDVQVVLKKSCDRYMSIIPPWIDPVTVSKQ